ncbi:DUF5305 family protein [Niameybacter massiliensis]|uniref:DUF5305 family protein n=1 Tax=Holtiella tumoricola TaxID=3018743 RepID=A0AA42DQ21_9FIRM|nr:DUF5305 family protein [Holtiella tumoricola]MDA3733150.1 DUF5305 family protein [Holtiella tumoricola]
MKKDKETRIGKKIKLDTKIKTGIIAGLIILIGILGLGYIQELKKENTVEEEKKLYEYTYNTDVKYAVNLIENELYEENKLGEDQIYLSEFIKSINNHFTVSFTGSEESEISGQYKIEAQVAGYTTKKQEDKEIKQDIWSKSFELVPVQNFKGKGTSYEIQKTAEVNYKSYNEFAKSIIEATKVNAPAELRIKVIGQMDIQTSYELIERPIEISTIMPLDGAYFTITVQGEETVEDSIKENVTVTLPPDQKTRVLYLVGIGITVLVAVLILGFTTAPTAEDKRIKEIKQLLTHYGSRMVGVKTIEDEGYDKYYEVKSLEDLVKIADELEQPLLYENNRDMLSIQKFYVIDRGSVYSYQLEKGGRSKKTIAAENGETSPTETANWEHLDL